MSNLFQRPNPETATINDINKAIKDITDWDWTTGYSFAHIVIDDGNMSDKDILYCLNPSRIAEVMNQKLKDEFGFIPDVLKLETWQQVIYEKHIEHMVELIKLLDWLLDIPSEVREEELE